MAEASDEVRQKLINALEKGNIQWSPAGKEYFDRAGVIKTGKEADFTIVSAEVDSFWGPYEKVTTAAWTLPGVPYRRVSVV